MMRQVIYQVAPRFTPGSPAQVDSATAERVAREERAAYQDELDRTGKTDPTAQGLEGVAECLQELANGRGWHVMDLITGRRYVRPEAGGAVDAAMRPAAPARRTVEERYMTDPMFHHLVDSLVNQIAAANYTPSELREAVILACTRWEERQRVLYPGAGGEWPDRFDVSRFRER